MLAYFSLEEAQSFYGRTLSETTIHLLSETHRLVDRLFETITV